MLVIASCNSQTNLLYINVHCKQIICKENYLRPHPTVITLNKCVIKLLRLCRTARAVPLLLKSCS